MGGVNSFKGEAEGGELPPHPLPAAERHLHWLWPPSSKNQILTVPD